MPQERSRVTSVRERAASGPCRQGCSQPVSLKAQLPWTWQRLQGGREAADYFRPDDDSVFAVEEFSNDMADAYPNRLCSMCLRKPSTQKNVVSVEKAVSASGLMEFVSVLGPEFLISACSYVDPLLVRLKGQGWRSRSGVPLHRNQHCGGDGWPKAQHALAVGTLAVRLFFSAFPGPKDRPHSFDKLGSCLGSLLGFRLFTVSPCSTFSRAQRLTCAEGS